MGHSLARIKGFGFLMWHARHEFYHVLLGLLWAWFLRERWNEFNTRWIFLSVFGSLLPDADHFVYFFSYGWNDAYTRNIRKFLRTRQWRTVFLYVEQGHKHNTNLVTHNIYIMLLLLTCGLLSSLYAWKVGVILFGAMLIHYMFDVADDLLILRRINPNWKRLRPVRQT